MSPTGHLRRMPAFVSIGALASLVHWVTAVALVRYAAQQPLVANCAGWALAFLVSFAGHQLWTFRDRATPAREGLGRFFLVSVTGFGINELSCLLWLAAGVHYAIAIFLSMAIAAVSTYVLSARWAFAAAKKRSTDD